MLHIALQLVVWLVEFLLLELSQIVAEKEECRPIQMSQPNRKKYGAD